MKVILTKDVENLGKTGAVIKVKDGFARNFLIPKGLAILSCAANLKKIEQEKQRMISKIEKSKKEAEEIAGQLAAISLTLPVLTKEDDKLYGGISAPDIAKALQEEGFDIDKNTVLLEEPIKSLGIYEVSLRLHPEVEAKIRLWVVKK